MKGLPVTLAQGVRRTLPFVYGLGLVCLIGALARPQLGRSESHKNTEGIAIELVLDMSGSMEALDFKIKGEAVSRVNAIKHVITQFVLGSPETGLKGRPDDLVGVVSFGGYADSKCPLTLDHGAVAEVLASLHVAELIRDAQGNVLNGAEDATAIGDGLTLACDRLRDAKAKSKIVILLTDGANNYGVVDPREEAPAIARQLGIKIYCIGIGQNGQVPYPVKDEFGNTRIVPAEFPIDEDLLQHIADETGGKYFHASKTEALGNIYAEIDKLERSDVEGSLYYEYFELYPYLAVPGAVLVCLVALLLATRFRALP